VPKKPTIRVRAGSAERAVGLLSQKEVAVLLKISERAVRAIERRAFDKLRRHPALREFWGEWQGIEEANPQGDWQLSSAEVIALLGLARTSVERDLLIKLIGVCRQ
jgi:hypothetical protein